MQKNKIIIYTDGAARGNPGPAGWGVVIMHNDKTIELGGFADHSTNNIMELTATIEALKYLEKSSLSRSGLNNIEIHSDSKYVILGITEWIFNWIKNDWKTSTKKPVLNQELWQELYILNKKLNPLWHYIKGHSGHIHNERADKIATSFADGEPPIPIKKLL
jgi:ribonuclease HI